jgi:hypothetical protein
MNNKPNKVFLHPEKEEIMSRLLSGESVKEIEGWLKKKHPKKRRLWISYATLQKFRKEHLHLEKDMIEDIKAARKEQDSESSVLEKKALILSSNAYQQKINEIVTTKLDSDRKLVELMNLLGTRIEYYFNMFQDPGTKTTLKEDKMFMELLNVQRTMIQDYKKYVERVADQRIEHNVNVTVVNEQITVLKNIVFEVLQSLDPSLVPLFVEKINARLLDVNHGTSTYDTYLNEPKNFEVYDAY